MSAPSFSFLLVPETQPGFYKGVAGSQVTLSSLVNQSRAMLEEQARHLLTEAERQTMCYYVEEYRDGHIGVEQLVVALFELLNTHAKVTTPPQTACFGFLIFQLLIVKLFLGGVCVRWDLPKDCGDLS